MQTKDLKGKLSIRKFALAAALLAVLMLMAACGGDAAPPPAAATPAPDATPTAAETVPTAAPTDAPVEAPSAFESPLQATSPLALPEVAPLSPLPTPPAVSAEAGAMVGRVLSASQPGNPPLVGEGVQLGVIVWREDGSDGDFAIDGGRGPAADIQADGTFVITDLMPADYMMVVGNLLGNYEILITPEGKAQVFPVVAGEVTDTGTLFVNLP